MFKECLKYNIVPFIIEENLKLFYYRGLKEWYNEKGYLTDTCLTAQVSTKPILTISVSPTKSEPEKPSSFENGFYCTGYLT